MASQGENERRQPPVSFTLPISCQVCLGKVKQPVVCPNLHVFCERCLEVWLRRNNQCPSCRAVISPENPAKHIIGGQAEEEHPTSKSCPELRRARFDLLYMEYEDQIEQLKKENLILRTENNILVAQVKEGDKAKQNGKSDEAGGTSSQKGPNPDGPSLLMLTRNLQEAQKLYSNIKGDMSRMKQENGKMKDENMTLTRENENLRLEIAQRSPKKFGRYTVATLETKVSEQDKEIRQLTKALERSDAYIEELQKKLEESNGKGKELKRQNVNPQSTTSGEVFMKKQPVKQSQGKSSEQFSLRVQQPLPSDKAKRMLFEKELIDERYSAKMVNQNQQSMSNGAGSASMSSRYEVHEPVASRSSRELLTPAAKNPQPAPDSILKTHSSAGKREISHRQDNMEIDEEGETPRRVHFNVPPSRSRTPEEAPSFDLELPSPMDRSTSTPRAAVASSSTEARPIATGMEDESYSEDSEFDIRVKDLLRKNAQTLKRSGSLETVSSQVAHLAKKSNTGQNNQVKLVGTATSKSSKLTLYDANDSSRLSVPDMGSCNATNDFSGMEDPDTNMKSGEDLNISMTPELSDCLRLMDKAEKNMVSGPSSLNSFTAPPNSVLPSRPSSVPPYLSKPIVSNSSHHSAGFSASTTGTGTARAWEQQFYSSLRANPYKQSLNGGPSYSHHEPFSSFSSMGKSETGEEHRGTATNPSHFSLQPQSMNQERNKSLYNYLPRPSSPSLSFANSQKQTFLATDTQHSNPRTSFPSSSSLSSHVQTVSSSRPTSTLPSKFNFPGRSSTMPPDLSVLPSSSSRNSQVSSSSLGPTAFSLGTMISQPSTSMADAFKFTPSTNPHFPSSIGRIGALSPHHKPRSHYTNPLPPSLNNSTLDWPDSVSQGRQSPHNLFQTEGSPNALDISISDVRPKARGFNDSDTSLTNDFVPPSQSNRHQHQQSQHQHRFMLTDDKFHKAMELPTNGYPGDLSHEMSSPSEVDLFSSPRRKFSYPENSFNDEAGMDDLLD